MVEGKEKKGLKPKSKPTVNINLGRVTLTLPLRTVSEANCSQHWQKKAKRHSLQRRAVAMLLNPVRSSITLPCHVHLVRHAPRKLDKHDNLPISFKYIYDAVCAIITGNYAHGQADNDPRISVTYDQFPSPEYSISILITSLNQMPSSSNQEDTSPSSSEH